MKNSSFSGLNLHERLQWFVLPPGGHFGVYDLLPQSMVKPEVHVDVPGLTALCDQKAFLC